MDDPSAATTATAALTTLVEPTMPERLAAEAPYSEDEPLHVRENRSAAQTLVRHLFAGATQRIDGLAYEVAYRLAEKTVGGDIVDVFHYDNGNAAFSIADIAGKGTQAAVNAAMVKYALRAYASHGLMAEAVLRALDRLFLENNAFERAESFASVFFAIFNQSRGSLTYASGGHEAAIVCKPDGTVYALPPTAPLIGIFDDQHHLFRERHVELEPGSLLVATTDGVTETRSASGEFYGMERFMALVGAMANRPIGEIPNALIADVERFSRGPLHDDIAVFAVRID
jgi:serine phosphatase RsbU (regulator of sigma subunit)